MDHTVTWTLQSQHRHFSDPDEHPCKILSQSVEQFLQKLVIKIADTLFYYTDKPILCIVL